MNRLFVKLFFGVLAAMLIQANAHAQGWCGTKLTDQQRQFLLNRYGQNQQVVLNKVNRTFNVTVWIVLNPDGSRSHGDGDVVATVEGLNTLFAPIGISFKVCQVNHIENWQFNTWDVDIHDPQADILYNQPNTINMYFMADIVNPAGAGGYAGDDIVIKDLGACSHEMGHFFGLPHTFESPGELVDRSNCTTTGDFICDTEADPDPTGNNVNGDCDYIGTPLRDANGDFYEPPTDNIMSYYPCKCRFTNEQYNVMAQVAASRSDLW